MTRIAITYGHAPKAEPYASAIRAVGAEPVLVCSGDDIKSLNGFAGLLLSGGTDIDPALYGETAGEHSQHPDSARDGLELMLLREALDSDLPVLAICRGMQLFNVAHAGGRLSQHIEGHVARPADPSEPAHIALIEPGTKLAEIVRESELPVNSRHHQAVKAVGRGLDVTARAPDGVIEALERPDRSFAIAVQWHPEDQIRVSAQRRLFEAFARACTVRNRT